jgi:hypothetical protein
MRASGSGSRSSRDPALSRRGVVCRRPGARLDPPLTFDTPPPDLAKRADWEVWRPYDDRVTDEDHGWDGMLDDYRRAEVLRSRGVDLNTLCHANKHRWADSVEMVPIPGTDHTEPLCRGCEEGGPSDFDV